MFIHFYCAFEWKTIDFFALEIHKFKRFTRYPEERTGNCCFYFFSCLELQQLVEFMRWKSNDVWSGTFYSLLFIDTPREYCAHVIAALFERDVSMWFFSSSRMNVKSEFSWKKRKKKTCSYTLAGGNLWI